MGTLASCFKKAGGALSDSDKNAILTRQANLRASGIATKDAAAQAVDELIAIIKTDLRAAGVSDNVGAEPTPEPAKKTRKRSIDPETKAELDALLANYNSAPDAPNPTERATKEHYNDRVRPAVRLLLEYANDPEESKATRAYAQNILDNEVDQKDIDAANAMTVAGKFRTRPEADSKPGIGLERVQQIVNKVLQSLGAPNGLQIQVVGKPSDVGITGSGYANAYGVTTNDGQILLFSDNLTSDIEAFKTIFHELFHLGLSKTLGQGSYIQAMLKFKTDALVRQYAARWKTSPDGMERKGKMPANNYEALAVEEALADIGEDLSLGNLGTKELKPFVKTAMQVMASVADALGMTKVAQAIRRMSYTEAEKFVMDTIANGNFGGETKLRAERFRTERTNTAPISVDPIQNLKDQFTDLTNGWRSTPSMLGWLSLDQIADRFPEMKSVQKVIKTIGVMGARARQFMETPTEVRKQWTKLYRDDPTMTKAMNELFVSSTLGEVWLDGNYANPMQDPRNKHLLNDDKALTPAEALALKAKWSALSPAHKQVYTQVLTELRKQFDAKQDALLKRIVDAYAEELNGIASPEELTKLARESDAKRKLFKAEVRAGGSFKQFDILARFLSDVDTNYIKPGEVAGPYFPLTRSGNFVMVKESKGFKAQKAAVQKAKEDFDAVYSRAVNSAEELSQYEKDLAEAKKALGEAKQALGEAKQRPDDYVVSFFQSRAAAERAAKELGLDPKGSVFLKQEYQRGVDTVSPSLVNRLSARIAKEMGTEVASDVSKAVRQFLIESLPDRAGMKSELKRMKVSGVDAGQAVNSFMGQTHKNAWAISRLENAVAIAEALDASRASREDDERIVGNELAMRFAKQLAYNEGNAMIDAAANMSHFSFLGLSVGYYVQNLLQPWLVTLPVMSGRFGMRKSAAEIAAASKEVVKALKIARKGSSFADLSTSLDYSKFTDPAEVELLKALTDEGLIDITIRADKGSGFAQTDSKVLAQVEWLSDVAAFPPHMIEVINRTSTALAAFRMQRARLAEEVAAGKMTQKTANDAAKAYAEKMIQQTQVDYTTENAPRFMDPNMLGGLGRLAFQFKRYQQAMAFLWIKTVVDAYRDMKSGKLDREAFRTMLYMSGTTLGVAGMAGMPLAAPAGLMLWAISKMDDDDEEKDLSQMFYAGLKDYAGETVANAARYGLPAAAGVNLSSKLGYGQTLGTGFMDRVKTAETGQEYMGAAASMLFGASGSLASNWVDAFGRMGDDPVKGVSMLMPAGLKNAIEAGNRAFGDGLTDRKGKTLLTPDELDVVSLVAKGIGFGDSTKVSNLYDARSAVLESNNKIKDVRDRLLRKAVKARDEGKLGEVQDDIQAFNERQPDNRILPKHILSSWKQEQVRKKELVNGVRVGKRDAALADAYGLTSD